MNAIELLKQDHRTVEQLFAKHEAAGDNARAEKRNIGMKICDELDVHMKVEEEIFYPAARDGSASATDDLVNEAYEEHQVAKRLVSEVRSCSPEADEWDAKMKVLQETIEHHVGEEENELFPRVRTALGSSYLDELGATMAKRKGELTKSATGSIGDTLVKMVSRAYDSLTGSDSSDSKSAKPRRGSGTTRTAKRAGSKTKRAARSAASRRTKTGKTPAGSTSKRGSRSASKRVGRSAVARSTSAKKRASNARTRGAVGKKSTRKQATKRRRSARR